MQPDFPPACIKCKREGDNERRACTRLRCCATAHRLERHALFRGFPHLSVPPVVGPLRIAAPAGALGQRLRQHGQLPALVQQPDRARLSIHQLLLPAVGIHPGVPVLVARRRAGDDPAIFLVAAPHAHLSRAPDRPRHHVPAHVAAMVLRPDRAVDSARRRERRGHGDADAGVGAAAGADLELAHLGAVGGGVSLPDHAVAHARAVEALAWPADRLVSGEPADFARAHAHLPAVLSRRRQGQPELADLPRLDAAVLGGAFRGGHADVAHFRHQQVRNRVAREIEALGVVRRPGAWSR